MYKLNIRHYARFLIPGTCTLMYYLMCIRMVRNSHNKHHVILDADHCILVL